MIYCIGCIGYRTIVFFFFFYNTLLPANTFKKIYKNSDDKTVAHIDVITLYETCIKASLTLCEVICQGPLLLEERFFSQAVRVRRKKSINNDRFITILNIIIESKNVTLISEVLYNCRD